MYHNLQPFLLLCFVFICQNKFCDIRLYNNARRENGVFKGKFEGSVCGYGFNLGLGVYDWSHAHGDHGFLGSIERWKTLTIYLKRQIMYGLICCLIIYT